MKTLLLIMIAVSGLHLTAQDESQSHSKQEHQNKSNFKDLTPEEAAKLKTKRMTLHLDLSETQQNEIQSIILEEENFKKGKREERKKTDSENGKPSKEEQLARMNEKLDRKIELKSKMKSILNDEQYKKWERMMLKKEKKKGNR